MPLTRLGLALRTVALVLTFGFFAAPAQSHQGADALIAPASAPAATAPVESLTGVVKPFAVENRISGETVRYVAIKLDDGRNVALKGSGLETLSTSARVQATGQRSGDTLFVSVYHVISQPASTRAIAPGALISVQGTLALVHADNFDAGKSTYTLVVRGDDETTTPLKLAVIPDTLQRGMRVIVSGTLAADGFSLDVDRVTVLAMPPAGQTPNDPVPSPVTNNVLVILVKFSTPADPFTQQEVDQVMRTNTNSVTNFYQEMSFGQQLLNVTVTPWLLSAPAPQTCDFTAIGNAGNAAATAAGYNLANYQNKFYVFPYRSDCGWAGLAYVGFPYLAWSNGYNQLHVYGHELGHNFSLWHAASLYCPGQVIGGSCSSSEYGDPFDVMGNINPMHFNAAQKSRLNWIPASSVRTHTSGSATYTLSPIESPGGTTYAVKIPVAANRTYWLEYRQPVGFDGGMSSYPNNGAQIRVAAPFESICSGCGDDTEILDMTPGTGNSFGDAALNVGQSFIEPLSNITVSVLSSSPTALSLQVSAAGSPSSLLNGSFEIPALGSGYQYSPSAPGIGWTFSGGGGIEGNGSAWSAASAPDGTQAAFIQGTGTIAQTVNLDAGSYTLSFQAAQRSCCSYPYVQPVRVSVDGVQISSLVSPQSTSFAAFSISFVVSTSGAHTIAFTGTDPSDKTTFIDAVTLAATGIGPTTTLVTSSPNPSIVGTSVTFTATVSGSNPTGSVNFTDGGNSIGGCATSPVTGIGNARTAICTTSSLTVGTHSIVAAYAGDAGNSGSSSTPLSQVVNPGPFSSLLNGSFEIPALGSGYQYGPSAPGIGWTFSGGGGIEGNGSAWSAASAPDGTQAAFIQSTGTIAQTVNLNAGSYTLSFQAAQRPCCTSPYIQPVRVSLDGVQIGSLVSPQSTSFAAFSISFVVSTSGAHTIAFTGTDPSDKTTFIDAVTLVAVPSLLNGSFEIPALGSGYQYGPSAPGIGWTFSGGGGIEGNGSAWSAASAPDGTQAAFIQSTGTIGQTVNLTAGSYTLSFQAAQRPCCTSPYIQPVRVSLDGVQIGSLVSPQSTSFAAFSISFVVSTSGAHTIAFTGTDPSDKTTFIDAVTLAAAQ